MLEKRSKCPKGFAPIIVGGKKYFARVKSCFFCNNVCNIIYDYTNGPYMVICGIDADINKGVSGKCPYYSDIAKYELYEAEEEKLDFDAAFNELRKVFDKSFFDEHK